MTFVHLAPLRWSDLDAQRHVNNALFIDYLQEARVGFLQAGPAAELLATGVVVVSHAIEYAAAIEYSTAPVEIDLGISAVGGAKFEVAYDIRHEGELKARARTVLCPFDFATMRPRRINEVERGWFDAHRVDVEPFRDLPVHPLARGYETSQVVRWSDLDSYGHVNNVKFFDYVQQARIEMTTAVDPTMARIGGGPDSTYTWLVARQDLRYLSQLDHRLQPYTMRTAPVKLGCTSITLVCEVTDGETIYGRAGTVLVCADADGRPVELPASTRERLGEWLA